MPQPVLWREAGTREDGLAVLHLRQMICLSGASCVTETTHLALGGGRRRQCTHPHWLYLLLRLDFLR